MGALGNVCHRGRVGEKFSTGGDHTAHTLLRGLDDYVYFNTSDGAGIRDRTPGCIGSANAWQPQRELQQPS